MNTKTEPTQPQPRGKKTRVWKVLRNTRTSTVVPPPLLRYYPVGVWVKPVPGTKLFAFRTKKDAKQNCFFSSKVVACEAINAQPGLWFGYGEFTIEKVQQQFSCLERVMIRDAGVMWCDALRALE